MSYNLQSLITILQQILNPEQELWILDHHNKPQLESLLERSVSLKQILENSAAPKMESLESRIRDAAHKAEDLIESHMVDQMRRHNFIKGLAPTIKALEVKKEMMMSIGSSSSDPAPTVMQNDFLQHVEQVRSAFRNAQVIHEGTRITFVTPDLQEVTQELDSAMEQVVKLMAEHNISSTVTSSSSGAEFLPADPTSKNVVVVGLDEDLFQLKDRLTNMQSEQLEIVPIVGMGGIGKTTLAQKLYDDRHIVSHFDVRAWTTISQDYNVRAILLGLLHDPNGKLANELIQGEDNEHLKIRLHQRLYARRYLIVLDDIWHTQCWDDIKCCFLDNSNGSRIVLTTRESYVARNVGTGDWQHELQLLKEPESWNLLYRSVFGDEDCPDALEEIGRKIARDCGGLPLAINVIGGVLSKAEREIDVWEHVRKDVRATIAETNNHEFSNVLSLSYNHLPNNVKLCFLYMGAFPEDYEIKASRLIQMWVAEGFLKSNGDKSLEEEAEDSLSALVERNLLLVKGKNLNGKPKSYGMHDLLREVCIRKADEEKFLLQIKNGSEVRLEKVRRVGVDTSCGMEDVYAYASADARSFICAVSHPLLCLLESILFGKLRLVRVLDVYEIEFRRFPREIYQLVNLRYLAVSWKSGGIPFGISSLRYLQTLIARQAWGPVPSDIWEMSELRHLKLVRASIYIKEGCMIKFVWEKLQTLSCFVVVTDSLMRRGFFESIPNIKMLGVMFRDELVSGSEVVDLTHLHKLQTLRCLSNLNKAGCCFPLQKLRFPSSLRKLILCHFVISGRFMTTLCKLPNLEVLIIGSCVFEDNEEWEAAEGDEFRSLQYLQFTNLKMVRWRADENNFPALQVLRIGECPSLEEIPSGIGEIPTLQLILLTGSYTDSALTSGKQIQKLQFDYGNDEFKFIYELDLPTPFGRLKMLSINDISFLTLIARPNIKLYYLVRSTNGIPFPV